LWRQEEQSRLDREAIARGEEPLPPLMTVAGARARAVRLLRWMRVLPPAPVAVGSDDEGLEEDEGEGSDGEDYDADEAADAFDDGGEAAAALAASGLKLSAAELQRQRLKLMKKLRTPANKVAAKALFGYRPRAPPGHPPGRPIREHRRPRRGGDEDDSTNSFVSSAHSSHTSSRPASASSGSAASDSSHGENEGSVRSAASSRSSSSSHSSSSSFSGSAGSQRPGGRNNHRKGSSRGAVAAPAPSHA